MILAIDPGAKTGLAWKRLGEPMASCTTDFIELYTTFARSFELWTYQMNIDTIVSGVGPDVVVVEGYSYGSTGNAVTKQAEIGGVIRAACGSLRVPVVEMPIQTWKAQMHRSPKGTKAKDAAYLDATFDCLGIHCDTVDIADAAMILATVDIAMAGEHEAGTGLANVKSAIETCLTRV
jgi:Holliday junction resolvasome RuvABC endonuclease subunit